MALDITTSTGADGARVVSATGEVDVSCASDLREAIDTALATGDVRRLDVNLAEVPYIDSTGIGVLVGSAQRASEAGVRFGVLNPQRNVRRVLDMLGISFGLGMGEAEA
ncbi:MAG: STAS domain-containing protein [Acidobacteriota bacterium]|nr:STAS domain-containing protein [Acidobacteriota bacterium]